ncbi:hypothetical protein TNCV_2099711 [Trichonephila clavipes]|nr:hypothetical protein TNCV_2099711 [Trichonephila clavipes]
MALAILIYIPEQGYEIYSRNIFQRQGRHFSSALRLPNLYVTPIGGRLSLDRFKAHRLVLQGESSVAIVSN